jgi:hypothetical protein
MSREGMAGAIGGRATMLGPCFFRSGFANGRLTASEHRQPHCGLVRALSARKGGFPTTPWETTLSLTRLRRTT